MIIIKTVFFVLLTTALAACNSLKEGIKETGDAVETGVHNAGEAIKGTPKAIGDASNKVEDDIRD
jgi:hypothetical protein